MSDTLRAELRRALDGGGPMAKDAAAALGDGPVANRLESSIRALVAYRGRRSSICPSDAARAVGGERWRSLMASARDVARQLARAGDVEIVARGRVLDPDADWRGPIRIRQADG